jgi:hypothetical protein
LSTQAALSVGPVGASLAIGMDESEERSIRDTRRALFLLQAASSMASGTRVPRTSRRRRCGPMRTGSWRPSRASASSRVMRLRGPFRHLSPGVPDSTRIGGYQRRSTSATPIGYHRKVPANRSLFAPIPGAELVDRTQEVGGSSPPSSMIRGICRGFVGVERCPLRRRLSPAGGDEAPGLQAFSGADERLCGSQAVVDPAAVENPCTSAAFGASGAVALAVRCQRIQALEPISA